MTPLPKLSCLFSALNKYIDNLNHVAANWKHGLFELCIFFLMLEHFPREKSQVLWLWKRKICISFWLSVSWYTHTHRSSFFLLSWLKWSTCLWEKNSIATSLGAAWPICQQNKMWKGYISIKVITFQGSLSLYSMWHYTDPRYYFLPDC